MQNLINKNNFNLKTKYNVKFRRKTKHYNLQMKFKNIIILLERKNNQKKV